MANPITFHEENKAAVSRFTHRWRILAPCLLLFALLTATLDSQSIWWDESISLHLAASTWREVLINRVTNIHPPLYFFTLKLWTSIVGTSPFAARYSSALAAFLLPVTASTFLRRRTSPQTGYITALLLALAPPFFIYGQEVRSYAFLPLFMLALLAQIWATKSANQYLNSPFTIHPFHLAFIQVTFVLTHYAGVVAVGWANFILLLRCLRRKDPQLWHAWLTSVGLTALLTLPWIIALGTVGAMGFRKEAGLSNALAAPLPVDYFLRLIGIFHTIGLPTAMIDPLLWKPALIVGCLSFATQAYHVLTSNQKPKTKNQQFLLLAWLLPLTAAPFIWMLSPQAHPRYLLPFILPAWLLLATLIACHKAPRLLRSALLAATLMMSLSALTAYLTNPTYARSDQRPIAAFLRQTANVGDVVLLPHTDHALRSYDTGAARIVTLAAPTDDAAMTATIESLARPDSRIFALDYKRGALDPRGQVSVLLESYGVRTHRQRFGKGPHNGYMLLDEYSIDTTTLPNARPLPTPFCVENAVPCLTSVTVQPHPVSGAALPVQLTWRGGPAATRYTAALRLYAPSGALVAGIDTLLLDTTLRPTELWDGEQVTTYHTVPLPPGLAPRAHRLEVGVYGTDAPNQPIALVPTNGTPVPAVSLGEVTPAIAQWQTHSAYNLPTGPTTPTRTLADGLNLWGATIDRTSAYAGQDIFITLNWHGTTTASSELPRLHLRQNGQILTETPALANLPLLPQQRPVLEHLALTIPPFATAGTARIVLLTASQEVPLGSIDVNMDAHTFIAPPLAHPVNVRVGEVATLLGYDLRPTPLVAGNPVTLTLIWRAENAATEVDLTVFVHLQTATGAMLAQHDGKPAAWTRPTTSWLPGEIITDHHRLTWQSPPRGATSLRVGLYDATTGTRIPWANGNAALLLDDTLNIVAP